MSDKFDPLAIVPEEATEFYRVLGRALWALGAVEYSLAHYIVLVLRSSFRTMDQAGALSRVRVHYMMDGDAMVVDRVILDED
jgi:hypothetical protein